jgi:anti-sigma28 factor (negative regulator of flagellin synthesis)
MSMRIENGNIGTIGNGGSTGSVRSISADDAAHSSSADSAFSDTVSLSSASSLIALAKNVISSNRESRITQLSSDLRSGGYNFSLRDVAQAMIKQST